MMTTEEIQIIIAEEIKNLNWSMQPTGLYEPVDYILSLGGKRIRPALALMGCDLFGGKPENALPAALAVEVFHNFTLLHDDLMDKADLRRGKTTVHRRWDENTAILSGDVMQIKAYELLAKTPEKHLKPVLDLFSKTACEICEGQQYDMDFEQRLDVSAEEYLNMIRLKTAVLLGAALKMGAIVANAPKEDADLLYNFGINIGLAFQLKDDLLDVYGNPETFGKKTGGDILCNKKTYLLITALERAEGETKKELLHWLSAKEYDAEEKINNFIKIYNSLKIKEICEEKMVFFFKIAESMLKNIGVNFENKQNLYNLANSLMTRII